MDIQADGANMFMIAGYICPKCLYVQKLLKPIPIFKSAFKKKKVILKEIREAWYVKEGIPFKEMSFGPNLGPEPEGKDYRLFGAGSVWITGQEGIFSDFSVDYGKGIDQQHIQDLNQLVVFELKVKESISTKWLVHFKK